MRNYLLLFFFGVLLLTGCEKTVFEDQPRENNLTIELRELPEVLCHCHTADLEHGSANNFDVIGTLTICNDDENVYILVEPDQEAYSAVTQYFLYLGDCDALPTNNPGSNLLFNDFPIQGSPNTPTLELQYAVADFDDCFCVSARIELQQAGNNGTHPAWADGMHVGNNQAQYFEYCVEECCSATTYTQGGWGSNPHGNDPGTYLHANFVAATGGSVVLGCADNNTMSFSSAQAITDFLPQGGTPAALDQDYIDPPEENISILAGQLLALSLNISFDTWENGGANLADMIINFGPFSGMTVQEFFDDANNFFGNCVSSSSIAAHYNDTATDINEYWKNGEENEDNLGFLSCF